MTSQERQRLITGWMRERMEQGYSALVAHSYALYQLGMMEDRQIQVEVERSRQEQRKARDISGFPDDDRFLPALADICFSCGKQETSVYEFYQWPESCAIPRLYCWDCWEHVSGKTLDLSRKPPRKEPAE